MTTDNNSKKNRFIIHAIFWKTRHVTRRRFPEPYSELTSRTGCARFPFRALSVRPGRAGGRCKNSPDWSSCAGRRTSDARDRDAPESIRRDVAATPTTPSSRRTYPRRLRDGSPRKNYLRRHGLHWFATAFLFKEPSRICSVAPPLQNANISLVCILAFPPTPETGRTPCLFVHFTKGRVSVFDVQHFLIRRCYEACFFDCFSIRQQYAGNEALCGYHPLRASPDSARETQSETQRPSTDGCCVIV